MNFLRVLGWCAIVASSLNVGAAQSQPASAFTVRYSEEPRFDGFGPVVKVDLDGKEGHLVVDTGSAPTILMDFFASSLRERSETCAGGIGITVDSRPLGPRPCAVIDAIAPFKDAGLAGMLSPQQLYPSGLVIIDLMQRKLSGYDVGAYDLEALLLELYPKLKFVKLERFGWSLGAVLVRASWGGRPDVIVDLDTGRPFTTFASEYVGTEHETQSSTASINAMGQRTENRKTVTAESLQIGPLTFPKRSVVLMKTTRSAAGITYTGLIGRDILQSCAIAIAPRPHRYVYLACRSD